MLPYYRVSSDCQAGLIEELEKLMIYDCHEHLPPEKARLQSAPDAFTIFSHYCQHDLYTAGMALETRDKVLWERADLDWKWREFKPYYQKCKDTAYFRAAHITLKRFYGADELTDENYRAVSERVAAANTEGLYRRVLRDACGIVCSLNCDGPLDDTDGGLLRQSVRAREVTSRKNLTALLGAEPDGTATMDDVDAALERFIAEAAAGGAFGVKYMPVFFQNATRCEAAETLAQLCKDGGKTLPRSNPLNDYLLTRQMRLAHDRGLVNAVHTGYWNDYRELSPANLLPVIMQNRDIRFDVYHVGYPYVREAIMLGKVWPNVRLNMAWTYLISQSFAADALGEMLEMLPDNKILGFGGDYYVIEKVFGHLCMARETIASVLADKIARRELTAERALRIAEKMLCDNPKEFYRL